MKSLLILNFIIPIVMLLVGYLLKKYPQEYPQLRIGRGYFRMGWGGYSTPSSRKSQERWDYAQSAAPAVFISFGKALFVVIFLVSMLFFFVPIDAGVAVAIGNIIGFLVIGISFFTVEKQISARFGK